MFLSESRPFSGMPNRQSDSRNKMFNNENEDEDEEPPEGAPAKVKRRCVLNMH